MQITAEHLKYDRPAKQVWWPERAAEQVRGRRQRRDTIAVRKGLDPMRGVWIGLALAIPFWAAILWLLSQ